MLCEATRELGIEPEFEFIVSINDWEQDQLIGQDIHKYIFDVKPLHTTIAHAIDEQGNGVVEKWQPHIETEVDKIKVDFPKVKTRYVRNSSLRSHPLMKQALLHTIEHRKEHKQLLLKLTGRPTLGEDSHFANALCPKCLDANTNTEILENAMLRTTCDNCHHQADRPYDQCDFWLYHKQLFPPRLAILDFQITISGADHFLQGDFQVRKALYEFIYNKPFPAPKMAFAPLFLAPDGEKMSKSRKNDSYLPFEEILPHARRSHSATIQLSE